MTRTELRELRPISVSMHDEALAHARDWLKEQPQVEVALHLAMLGEMRQHQNPVTRLVWQLAMVGFTAALVSAAGE